MQREQPVTINVDPNGDLQSVIPDKVYISKSAHEEVQWLTNPPNAVFRVVVANSPFYYPDFDQDNPYSGEVKRHVPGDDTYCKYTVTAGAKSLDPGIIVNR